MICWCGFCPTLFLYLSLTGSISCQVTLALIGCFPAYCFRPQLDMAACPAAVSLLTLLSGPLNMHNLSAWFNNAYTGFAASCGVHHWARHETLR